jgi:enoyl-CoA hydratase
MNPETEQVRARRDGPVGRIELNRPEAINALTLPMVRALTAALLARREDPAVEVVVLTGAGERGLCAGGDIVAIHRAASGETRRRPSSSGARSTSSRP